MSAPTRLFIDTWNRVLVAGPSKESAGSLRFGDIYYGDVISYRVYLLEINPDTGGKPPRPFSTISLSGLSLHLAVGALGNSTTSPVAEQATWSKSDDNTYFFADVSFTTAEMQALLGSGDNSTQYLEIKVKENGNAKTVFQQQVTIRRRAISPTTVVPSSPLTAISREEVNSEFMRQEVPAGGFQVWTSPLGIRYRKFVDDNGEFQSVRESA